MASPRLQKEAALAWTNRKRRVLKNIWWQRKKKSCKKTCALCFGFLFPPNDWDSDGLFLSLSLPFPAFLDLSQLVFITAMWLTQGPSPLYRLSVQEPLAHPSCPGRVNGTAPYQSNGNSLPWTAPCLQELVAPGEKPLSMSNPCVHELLIIKKTPDVFWCTWCAVFIYNMDHMIFQYICIIFPVFSWAPPWPPARRLDAPLPFPRRHAWQGRKFDSFVHKNHVWYEMICEWIL